MLNDHLSYKTPSYWRILFRYGVRPRQFNSLEKFRSLGESFVTVDWQVGVFDSYVLVDRTYDHLYARTIPLSGCIYIHSYYIPLSSQALMAFHKKTCALAASLDELYPYGSPFQGPPGTTRDLNFSREFNCLGRTPYRNSILQ